jgi:hypothetical protein
MPALRQIRAHYYKPGFILRFPDPNLKIMASAQQRKLFKRKRIHRWNEMMGASKSTAHSGCIDGSISQIIRVSEGFTKEISQSCREIKKPARM